MTLPLKNTRDQWGLVAQVLHWLIFLVIVGAWLAVEMHEDYPKGSAERAQLMALHKSLGLSVFFLVWLRLGWRLGNDVPTPEPGPRWQQWSSSLVHAALYLLMIVMPLSGLFMQQFEGHAVAWFGLFEIPPFVTPDKAMGKLLEDIHTEVLWPLLLGLVGLHVLAALWHHFVRRDRTLRRMLPWRAP